eukprot:CAMPEP_0114373554 /NCGR_PEP_ID=MMETSP0101-20121206/34953_1 /TAXON_ID=38822 ORGANISM="Pteridomonas danica, Strain PT" /NCGR_SAMPLE_ID=MMETSP0101 /ASSEMBLY_ACC=CAM_ASM_000211 /LENGTH=279 /DNA_ID=CAMNT_0001526853 /DNA_START=89 /DNA_END=929 /DNA_ORIENTATION=+
MKLELYRLILAPMSNSILNLVFTFMCFNNLGATFERSLGSARFAWLLVGIGLISNIGFDVFCFLMALLGTYEALFFQCQGFWVILFGLIAIECAESQEPTRQLFRIPYQIPTVYYPLVLFALFSILSGPNLGSAIAMGFGYAYGFGKVEGFRPSLIMVQGWERDAALGSGAWAVQDTPSPASMEAGESRRTQPKTTPAEQASPFPGGGQALSHVGGTLSKDAARQARLAALESRGSAAKTQRWPMETNTLVDMGYDEDLANRTLEACGGNLLAAVERLS